MRARHPRLPDPRFPDSRLPEQWLMTDERMGNGLWAALERVPRGGGIVFRHYGLPRSERAALFARIARVARRRRLVLVRAGSDRLAPREAGSHGRHLPRGGGLRTWPAHNHRELVAGQRAGADLIFLSPIFQTRSHAGGRVLGVVRGAALARRTGVPVIALGGVTSQRLRQLKSGGFYGWAAIDAWIAPKRPD